MRPLRRTLVDLSGRPLTPGRGVAPLELLRGFTSLFSSCLTLFVRPEFAGKLKIPFLVNFVVLVVVFFGLFLGTWEFMAWMLEDEWTWWLEWARPSPDSWFAGGVSLLLAAIAMFFLTPVLIETVMGPFLDPLAQVIEKVQGGPRCARSTQGSGRARCPASEAPAQILIVQLVVLPLALILSLTGIGAIAAFALAGILNAVVWFDIPEFPSRLRTHPPAARDPSQLAGLRSASAWRSRSVC